MPDVFLSYSSKDRAAAQRVQQTLEACGIDVFWDQETPPGQDWDTWIRGKLTACKLAVSLRTHPLGWWGSWLFAIATVLALAWQHWPLVWVLLGIGGTCYVLVYAQLARQAAHAAKDAP